MSLPLQVALALAQCKMHAQRFTQAVQDSGLPLPAMPRAGVDDGLIRILDQLVFRYMKLQDTMGEHVLRAFCVGVLQEPLEDAPMIDVLNRLEKRGYLLRAQWQAQRDLRNALTHEYPDAPERQLAAINAAQRSGAQLIEWLTRLDREARAADSAKITP